MKTKFRKIPEAIITRTKYLIRFFEVMRGALMAAPIKLLPVMYIPLQNFDSSTTKHGNRIKESKNTFEKIPGGAENGDSYGDCDSDGGESVRRDLNQSSRPRTR